MFTLVIMIRGINVAGKRPMKMDVLRGLCEDLGFRRARTYLQSGNVVCEAVSSDAKRHGAAIERRILRDCGFEVGVAALTSKEMTAAVSTNPLVRRPSTDPRFLHATFLIRPAGKTSLEGIPLPLAPGEDAVLVGDVVYVYCPNGYGITKINNSFFEKKLGVNATTRNWQTVTALARMCLEAPPET